AKKVSRAPPDRSTGTSRSRDCPRTFELGGTRRWGLLPRPAAHAHRGGGCFRVLTGFYVRNDRVQLACLVHARTINGWLTSGCRAWVGPIKHVVSPFFGVGPCQNGQ